MSSLGRDNLISCQVAPAGHTMFLTCGVLLSQKCRSIPLPVELHLLIHVMVLGGLTRSG